MPLEEVEKVLLTTGLIGPSSIRFLKASSLKRVQSKCVKWTVIFLQIVMFKSPVMPVIVTARPLAFVTA